jgi:hypothetical protein
MIPPLTDAASAQLLQATRTLDLQLYPPRSRP